VPPLPLRSDETGFGQPRKMFACRLRADVGRQSQFPGRDGATAHQLKQHGRPGRLCEQFGCVGECVTHEYSMRILFRQHFGLRRSFF
jgi:hypothetical protein